MTLIPHHEASLPNQEVPTLLTVEDLTYKGLVRQIALTVIKRNYTAFASLPWLKDSPIIEVAPHIEEIENNSAMTSLKPEVLSKEGDQLFVTAFKQLCLLAHVDQKAMSALLTKAGLVLVKKTLARPTGKASGAFEHLFISDQAKAIAQAIPPENSITRENGVHWQNREWKYQGIEDSAHKAQLALATSLAYFLRNQANLAGQINHNSPSLEDKKYAKFIKKAYFEKIKNSHPPRLKIKWNILAPELASELTKVLPDIPESSDNDVSDMTAYFPPGSSLPLTNHPDFENKQINSLPVLLLHHSGRHYLKLGIRDVLRMSPKKLSDLFVLPTTMQDTYFAWHSITDLEQDSQATNHPFALRMDWLSQDHPITPFEHNIINFLSISCDPTRRRAKLEWRSGHFPSDGAIRNEALNRFSMIIKDDILPGNEGFVQELDPNSDSVDISVINNSRSFEDLLKNLRLGKVVVGTTYDSRGLTTAVNNFNRNFVDPQNFDIKSLSTNNPSISGHISQLIHVYEDVLNTKQDTLGDGKDQNEQRRLDVIAQIEAVLNPHLAPVDALSIASGDTCTTATCAVPFSRLRRLVTYASDHINHSIRSIRESIKLTTTERVLSKLGHGWQSTLAVSVKDKEKLSKNAAKSIAQKLTTTSLPVRQLSDLTSKGQNNYFVTALSARIDELSAGIGVDGDYLTERVDLEKTDFINSLPLNEQFLESDINFFAKMWPNDAQNITTRLYQINNMLRSHKNLDSLTLLKSIAQLEPTNPRLIIKQFLIANIYRELNKLPVRAITYVNKAIMGQ